MNGLLDNFTLLWEAMFLKPEPYIAMRDRENPVGKGFVILIVLGLALALASWIGGVLNWASSPNLTAIQEIVLRNLQQMDWWQLLNTDPEFQQTWFQIWDSVWMFVQALTPSPVSGLSGFVFTPLSLIVSWLVFGVVAHLMARLFGGHGEFSQTLGTTSIASAPQLLGLFAVFPFSVMTGIGVWVLLARYLAIRVTHGLSWARAVWVVVLTLVVLYLILFVLFTAGVITFSSIIAATFGG